MGCYIYLINAVYRPLALHLPRVAAAAYLRASALPLPAYAITVEVGVVAELCNHKYSLNINLEKIIQLLFPLAHAASSSKVLDM